MPSSYKINPRTSRLQGVRRGHYFTCACVVGVRFEISYTYTSVFTHGSAGGGESVPWRWKTWFGKDARVRVCACDRVCVRVPCRNKRHLRRWVQLDSNIEPCRFIFNPDFGAIFERGYRVIAIVIY